MRNTRLAAIAATTALSAGIVLSGAGAAQAQSLDLGSLGLNQDDGKPALEISLDKATPEGVNGTVTAVGIEDLSDLSTCAVAVSHADVIKLYENAYDEDGQIPGEGSPEYVELQKANELKQNWIAFPAFTDDATVEWTGAQGPDKADADYRAGAMFSCDYDDEKLVAFDYEPTNPIADFIGSVEGFFGNIFGSVSASLGSSGPADDDNDDTVPAPTVN